MRKLAPHGAKVNRSVYGQSTPLRLNRNFGNFPLARSARIKVRWVRGGKRWRADLPGEDKIQIWFPAETDKAALRLLTGFDMNLLAVLLAETQRLHGNTTVTFSTASVILKRLGLQPDQEQRDRLYDSLALLSVIKIRHREWHCDGKSGRKVLPPPIKRWEQHGYRLNIELDPAWLALDKNYYVRVPLPLPLEATDQNLALRILTLNLVGELRQFSSSSLARKVGITAWHRRKRLEAAIEQARLWFELRGGSSDLLRFVQGQVAFVVEQPPVPRHTKKTANPLTEVFEAFEAEVFEEFEAEEEFTRKREQEEIRDPYADL